jgi:hypothetical protein
MKHVLNPMTLQPEIQPVCSERLFAMRSIRVVLQEKELQLENLRREVEALRAAIALLLEDECAPQELANTSDAMFAEQVHATRHWRSITDLEIYYPFIKKLRTDTVG